MKGGPRAHRGREASSRRGPCANDRPDVALHGLPEGVVDAATLGDFYATFWSGVSHAQASIEDVFESESDEKVDARLLLTGTHDGELMRPATSFEHVRESAHCDRARFQDAGRDGRASRASATGSRGMATVLLVDDEDSIREVLRLYAEALGLDVIGEAADGSEAVPLAARLRPDVIVLDHEMPVMTGLEAMPRLRRRVPDAIIVFYSSGTPTTERAVRALGAAAWVTKAETPRTVMRTVMELLEATDRPVV